MNINRFYSLIRNKTNSGAAFGSSDLMDENFLKYMETLFQLQSVDFSRSWPRSLDLYSKGSSKVKQVPLTLSHLSSFPPP